MIQQSLAYKQRCLRISAFCACFFLFLGTMMMHVKYGYAGPILGENEAKEVYRAKNKRRKVSDSTPKASQIRQQPPGLRLEGLIFVSPGEWSLWLNGHLVMASKPQEHVLEEGGWAVVRVTSKTVLLQHTRSRNQHLLDLSDIATTPLPRRKDASKVIKDEGESSLGF